MLPTAKTPPKQSLTDLTVLLYGPAKCGKSSWCSHADAALFLCTEPGLNHLEVFQEPILTWEKLLQVAKELAEGKHAFRTVVIDTVDNAYRMCAEYICQRNKVEHESDLEYGKGYSLVNTEFHRVINKLALLPYGLFLVSHAVEKEVETRTGKHTRTVPTLPDKARKQVLGLVDLILYCDFETGIGSDSKAVHRRVLRTKPSANYEAGDRTGRLPETIDFDYAAFASAFAAAVAGSRPEHGGGERLTDGPLPHTDNSPVDAAPPSDDAAVRSSALHEVSAAPTSPAASAASPPSNSRATLPAQRTSTPSAAKPRSSSAPTR